MAKTQEHLGPRRYDLVVEKLAQRRLDPEVLQRQLKRLVRRATAGERRAWSLEGSLATPRPRRTADGWRYRAKLTLTRSRRVSRDVFDRQIIALQSIVATAGASRGWVVPGFPSGARAEKKYVEVPGADRGAFDHLYGLDAQVDIVLRTIDLAKSTGFAKRMHTLLYGPPGCGKTELLRSVVRMLGRESVLEFDATSTTQAGAIRVLQESAEIPRVLIIEEIEKVSDEALRWLLAVLDTRSEIRKTVHRATIETEVRLLALASANSIEAFERALHGALVDRFQRVYCPQPSPGVMKRILEREVQSMGGRQEWVAPAMEYAAEEGIQDVRRAIYVCLVGRDGLLDGSFQRSLRAAAPASRDGEPS